jgi:phosphoserine phosphatase
VWAYGDSSGDRDLLARADQGVMVGERRGRA